METKFNFKSSPCTSIEQSKRLLALGLKKETRDVVLKKYIHNDKYCYKLVFEDVEDRLIDYNDLYPAWSFDRLWEILPKDVEIDDDRYVTCHLEGENAIIYHDYGCEYYNFDKRNNRYDNIIDCIEWLIKEGYFNKEYLEE